MNCHPMTTFDPSRPALVHDRRNDRTFEWLPQWAAAYRRFARQHAPGIMDWDGVLLDGWIELPRTQAGVPQQEIMTGLPTGRRARS